MAFERNRRGKSIWYAKYKRPDATWAEEPAKKAGYQNTKAGASTLERKRKDQVTSGTYDQREINGRPTIDQYLKLWTAERTTRNKLQDEARLTKHLMSRVIDGRRFGAMRIDEPGSRLIGKLFRELFADPEIKISKKTRADVYGLLHTMYHAARADELVLVNPCVLKKGDKPRKSKKPQRVYDRAEAQALLTNKELESVVWMLFVIMAFTGERLGEACGHRWGDWLENPEPLGALNLERQYEGAPLKSDTDEERPRMIPVHPELARALDWWKGQWLGIYGRDPLPSDPIVPNPIASDASGVKHFTRNAAFKRARRRFEALGLTEAWKGHHAMRRTFVSQLRRASDRRDMVNKITHNPSGDITDVYTYWEWEPLCAVVEKLPLTVSFPECLVMSSSRTTSGPEEKHPRKYAVKRLPAETSIPRASTFKHPESRQFGNNQTDKRGSSSPGFPHESNGRGRVREFRPAAWSLALSLESLLARRAA